MNRLSKLFLVAAAAGTVVSAGTVLAYASWPVPGRPVSLEVRAVDMPAGTQPTADADGPDAVITWSSQEIGPGAAMQGYVVRRHDARRATEVKAFGPVTATSFTDTAVPPGKWYWTVTPRFAGWTGAESKRSEELKFTAAAPPAPDSSRADTSAPEPPDPTPVHPPPAPKGGSPVASPAAPPSDAEPPPGFDDSGSGAPSGSVPVELAPSSVSPSGDPGS